MNHGVPTAQGRGVPTSPVTGTQPALTAELPVGYQDLGRLTPARLCAARTCTVWRSDLLPGQLQGCTDRDKSFMAVPIKCARVVLGCSPHYGTLDQKADEMEVLGR